MSTENRPHTGTGEGKSVNSFQERDIITIGNKRGCEIPMDEPRYIRLLSGLAQRGWITDDTLVFDSISRAYKRNERKLPDMVTLFHLEALVNVRAQREKNPDGLGQYIDTVNMVFPELAYDEELLEERAFVVENVDITQLISFKS